MSREAFVSIRRIKETSEETLPGPWSSKRALGEQGSRRPGPSLWASPIQGPTRTRITEPLPRSLLRPPRTLSWERERLQRERPDFPERLSQQSSEPPGSERLSHRRRLGLVSQGVGSPRSCLHAEIQVHHTSAGNGFPSLSRAPGARGAPPLALTRPPHSRTWQRKHLL